MILSVEGEEGSGKTAFAYTAPLPIVGFQFDLGADRAIYGAQYDKWFKGLAIHFQPYEANVRLTKEVWREHDITILELPRTIQIGEVLVGISEQWQVVRELMAKAATDPAVASVVCDTATLARRVSADAYLQGLQEKESDPNKRRQQLIQIEWGHANQEIHDIYNLYKATGKNFIAVHHLTDERVPLPNAQGIIEQTLTGNKILEGYNKTPQLVDVRMVMSVEGNQIKGVLKKCGYNLDLVGLPLMNPTWDSLTSIVSGSIGNRIEFGRRWPEEAASE